MNLEGIKYWFQIPLSWFRKIDRLLHTHGGSFVNYDKDAEDGPLISIDTERLASYIDGKMPDISSLVNGVADLSDTVSDLNDSVANLSETVYGIEGEGGLVNLTDVLNNGLDRTRTVVTHVSWDGTTLSFSSETWTFTGGVLTGIVQNEDETIDTPVAYNPT